MQQLLDLIRLRRSCRQYDPNREVPEELLGYCIEAARLAPSACNRQPWHFTVVRNKESKTSLLKRGVLPGIQLEWLQDCPCIVVLSVKAELKTHRLGPLFSGIPYHYIDAGIAGEHFILAAAEQGLGTCWIGWIRPKRIRKNLGLEKGLRPVALIATGYPGDPKHFEGASSAGRKGREEITSWQ
jgi:nitroreductase